MKKTIKLVKLMAVLTACLVVAGCDDVRVYGSVGYSSYGGYNGYHGGGYGTRMTVGGRIY
jgi:predicted small secreted protein